MVACAAAGWLATGPALAIHDAGAPPAASEAVGAELPRPSDADLARVDALTLALLAPEREARAAALVALRSVDAALLPALDQRFRQLAVDPQRAPLKLLLRSIRRAADPWAGGRAPVGTLELIVEHPDRSSAFLRPLTALVAQLRMFEAIGTPAAARRVIAVYSSFGELLQADVERAIERLGDRAVAALIEATAHPAPRVAAWAKQRLDRMGKLIASEAIQVDDPALRPDILMAYGKTRDVGTARLLIGFAASDHAESRRAARQALMLLGEPGLPFLRDAHERATGRRPADEQAWDSVARALFAAFDRQRFADLHLWLDEGLAMFSRGDLPGARERLDQVLAGDPSFDRGPEMAPVYLALAEQQAEAEPEAALADLRRAEHLAGPGPLRDRALSLRRTLEARALLRRGVVDPALIHSARQLDPDNSRAAELEAQIAGQERGDALDLQRWIGVLLAATAVLILLAQLFASRRSAARAAPRP